MSLPNVNFLQLDVQALSMKNRELSKTVVKLKSENAELQNELISSKSELFEKQQEVNRLQNGMDMFEMKVQLCMPKMKELVEMFGDLYHYCTVHKGVSTPVVRLERLNNSHENTYVFRKPNSNSVNFSYRDDEDENDLGEETESNREEDVPELRLSTITEENGNNTSPQADVTIKNFERSSSLSHLEHSNLSLLDDTLNVKGGGGLLPAENTTYFQTPSFSSMGDKTALSSAACAWSRTSTESNSDTVRRKTPANDDTPIPTLSDPKEAIGELRTSPTSLECTDIQSPKQPLAKPHRLTPKRLSVVVTKLQCETIERAAALRDCKVVLDASEVENNVENRSPARKKASNSKRSTKRKKTSGGEGKMSMRSSDGSSTDGSPRKTRPKRAARPGALKEPSLNKKMRRSK